MTTTEAAKVLGTDVKTVREWVNSGRLPLAGRAGRSFLLDTTSVKRLSVNARHLGRAWESKTAWAAMDLLSGGQAEWMIPQNRSRLRTALRASTMTASRVHSLARNRSLVHRYRGHQSVAGMITGEVMATGNAAIAANPEVAHRFGLAASQARVDGYVGTERAEEIAAGFALTADPDGDIVLRAANLKYVSRDGSTPVAAIALDMMDSLATRERSAGERVLNDLLDAFRNAWAMGH